MFLKLQKTEKMQNKNVNKEQRHQIENSNKFINPVISIITLNIYYKRQIGKVDQKIRPKYMLSTGNQL